VADKITQQIIDALSKAAADPAGLPLYAGKAEPGLFPPTTAAKPAAQKCLADGLVRVVGTEARSKAPREQYGLTDKGWDFLLAAVNPKQVLEDFVRVLEARQGEVGELLATARRMADSLHGLKEAVARVIPRVTVARVPAPEPHNEMDDLQTSPLSGRHNLPQPSANGSHPATGTALLDAPAAIAPKPDPAAELAAAILTRLSDWASSAAVGEDCPLPTLFRSLGTRNPAPTIGEFHDCLRALDAAGIVGLQPWTGPLYALPEPAYALLAGHSVAYYASAH
jgi:hypothetical protein